MLSTSLKPERAAVRLPAELDPDRLAAGRTTRSRWTTAALHPVRCATRSSSRSRALIGTARLRRAGRLRLRAAALPRPRPAVRRSCLATMMLPEPGHADPALHPLPRARLDQHAPAADRAGLLRRRRFYIFLLRQFFLTIPLELDDAARIDGASSLADPTGTSSLPLAEPALAAVAIFSFMHSWNDFLEPADLPERSSRSCTLALGLAAFRGVYQTEWHLMMAASLLILLPSLVLFFVASATSSRASRPGAEGLTRYSARWQATRCPARRPAATGSSTAQRSVANGQRVWKRQPRGGSTGLGTSPVRMIRSRAAARRRVGRPARPRAAPACRGGAGARTARRRGAISTILPRYITATRSADVPHDREVVGDEQVGQPELAPAGRSSRLMICAWIETSSAETGSSQTMKLGLEAPARARCRSAAAGRRENSCG